MIKMYRNKWFLYEFLHKNPNLSVKQLTDKIGWSERKTRRNLRKLISDGIVREKKGKYFPTPWDEMINWDEMKHTKK